MPLVAAVEEYARCRELLGDVPMMAAIQEFVRRNRGVHRGVKAKAEDNLSRIYRLFWPLAGLPGCAWLRSSVWNGGPWIWTGGSSR